MKKIILILIIIGGCQLSQSDSERLLFVNKLEALQLLSKYHHELHIMIGEDKGDGKKAFNEFLLAMQENKNNPELIPIYNALSRIDDFKIASPEVMKVDYLVDYYQSGLALSVEGVMRGYGVLRTLPLDSMLIVYDNLFSLD